jgi:hypothetical protein
MLTFTHTDPVTLAYTGATPRASAVPLSVGSAIAPMAAA